MLKTQGIDSLQRDPQMATMDRVESTTKQANRRCRIRLGLSHSVCAGRRFSLANLTISEHDPFLRRQPFQANRTTGVKLVGTDTNLGTQSVLKAIRKAG